LIIFITFPPCPESFRRIREAASQVKMIFIINRTICSPLFVIGDQR
jgi:hypothetical protein